MIDFNNIGKHSYTWDIIMPYYRFALRDAYFKEFVVVGRENIPPPGMPAFIIANHQNSALDGLVIVGMFKDFRQPVFLARGDVFKNNIVAKILRFWRVMPTFRLKDSGGKSDLMKNLETFQIAAHILKTGGVIGMFPEAMHQEGRYLGTFKKGVPRICFEAEEAADYELNLQILPVNLHYSNIHNFREKVLVEIGKPFGFSEFLEIYKNNPNEAYLQFNEKARTIFKSMVLDIEDTEHYEEYNLLREMIRRYRIKNNYKKYNYFDEFKEEKKVISEIDTLKEETPERFETLMTETKQYAEGLKKLNLRDWLVNKKLTGFGLIFKTLLMVLFSPFFLFGFINNAIPCLVPNMLSKKIKDKVFMGSIRYVLGFIFYPVWCLLILLVASLISGSFIVGLSYTVLAFLSLFVYYRYRVTTLKLWHSWRYFLKRRTGEVEELKNLKSRILLFF
ncbi:MAG: 1-acyl-sn-glycerol-3-phosphate acyltransferase [Bacteroidetes bacterium]|nr:1-acyl-sn-glycerol-3-phosphate acyltransferase [Bacteroidota bacterium]MCL2301790.1 1-acyl-sn-glycerol-3-phosphate acyltransferase [Lentimicrobiaceae bacterium]